MEKLTIVKIGGNVIDNEQEKQKFLRNFSALSGHKILVHGGGKIATQVAEKLGIPTLMVEGRRITDKAMLDVVTMVYGGLVNKTIVAQLQAIGANAIGLTGADAGTVLARKRPVKDIDYGYVGDVEQVNASQIASLLNQRVIPVFAPLTYNNQGNMLNTNADTMASALAVALSQVFDVSLVYCFEKKGVLSDPENEESVIARIQPQDFEQYKAEGVIYKGMIPKLDNAFAALNQGVSKVIICHAADLPQAAGSGTPTTGTTLVL